MTEHASHGVAPPDAGRFDYVVVGAGAAGAILAHRLSEDGRSTVCLLEAGPKDWHPFLHIPAGFIKMLFDPAFTWPFQTEASDWTNGRRIPVPQGRTLGGSTAINGMVYNRGLASDYDRWAAMGNPGWSFADVLPYFKRTERFEGGQDPYRGRSGELPITRNDWQHPLCEAFIQGAGELGLPRNDDYNGATQAGAGYFQRTIARGWRQSTARAFLRPAQGRANLDIRTRALASRIVFQGTRATGVDYFEDDQAAGARRVHANREVIVCAGAINTPKLLQLSGLGPAEQLQMHGIPVLRNLDGVGQNLSDHFSVRLVARVRGVRTLNQIAAGPSLVLQALRWGLKRPSVLALCPSVVHYFWTSRPGLPEPDLQGVFAPASYREGYVGMLDKYPGMTAGVWQHRPNSRGHVRLASADPRSAPLIQPHYLAHEEDRRVLVDGIRLARRLLSTRALVSFVEQETLPGAQCQSDDELLDFARRYGVSSYHLNGTARMGPAGDGGAVVDAQLRVHGLDGLRVADSSVMPSMPSANICAATMMIGEKAADLIRAR